MIDKSKTYKTRDDREVRILVTDLQNRYPVAVAVKNPDGHEIVYAVTENGKLYDDDEEASSDLIEVKPRFRIERWVNVYPHDSFRLHLSRADAMDDRTPGCLATKRIIIEGIVGEDDA